MKKFKLRAHLDRIEDGRLAVFVLSGGGEFVLPARLFPWKLKEGGVFDLLWTPNPAAERRLRAEVRSLQAALVKRSRRRPTP